MFYIFLASNRLLTNYSCVYVGIKYYNPDTTHLSHLREGGATEAFKKLKAHRGLCGVILKKPLEKYLELLTGIQKASSNLTKPNEAYWVSKSLKRVPRSYWSGTLLQRAELRLTWVYRSRESNPIRVTSELLMFRV